MTKLASLGEVAAGCRYRPPFTTTCDFTERASAQLCLTTEVECQIL
jgi:hypothetical protein